MIGVVLYGCVTWAIVHNSFAPLRETIRGFVLRCLCKYTSSRSAPDYRMPPYRKVLERNGRDCVEAAVMRRVILHAGRAVHAHNDAFPKSLCVK